MTPIAVINSNAKVSSEATQPVKPQVPRRKETPISIVESLARSVRKCGEHNDCSEDVAALIDIAMFKNTEANSVSRHAEQHLLNLFGQPSVSATTRRQMIDRLFEADAILMHGTGANAAEFAMPASLKHLMAQYMRCQMASQEFEIMTDDDSHLTKTGLVTDEVHLAEMELSLLEASKLHEENIRQKVTDPDRFVTTDEILASFAQLDGAHQHVINLSGDIEPEAAKMQMGCLLDSVPDTGVVLAPLLVDEHFMLMAAEKIEASNKYKLTIANTHLPIGQVAIEAMNDPSNKQTLDDGFIHRLKDIAGDVFSEKLSNQIMPAMAERVDRIDVLSNHLQAHAINSCGPLVTMLAAEVTARKPGLGSVGELIRRLCDRWRQLKPQQQKDQVLAQRSKMIGDTVESQRAAWPAERRFVDSYAFLPRPKVQS